MRRLIFRIRMYFARLAYKSWLRLDVDRTLVPTFTLQEFRETRGLWGRCHISYDEMKLSVDGHWYRYLTEQTTPSIFIDAARIFHKEKSRGAHIGISAADEFLMGGKSGQPS